MAERHNGEPAYLSHSEGSSLEDPDFVPIDSEIEEDDELVDAVSDDDMPESEEEDLDEEMEYDATYTRFPISEMPHWVTAAAVKENEILEKIQFKQNSFGEALFYEPERFKLKHRPPEQYWKPFGRKLYCTSEDFWDHIKEEISDYLSEQLTTISKCERKKK